MSARQTAAHAEICLAPTPRAEPVGADPAEVARYVSQMAAELAALSRSAKLDVLAYFLDMARVEAASVKPLR